MEKITEIINWPLAVKRANGKQQLAKDLLKLLIETLPEHQKELKTAFTDRNLIALQAAAHKLHSATCYCGTPKLKLAAKNLETIKIPAKEPLLSKLYQILCNEIESVQKAYKSMRDELQ